MIIQRYKATKTKSLTWWNVEYVLANPEGEKVTDAEHGRSVIEAETTGVYEASLETWVVPMKL